MTDQRVSDDFAAADGKRELEIFMLTDAGRKAFRELQEKTTKERDALRKLQEKSRADDIAAARKEVAARKPRPELAPFWKSRSTGLKASEIETLAERLVDVRNEKEARDLYYAQRQREDNFLTRQREERLLREAAERSPDTGRDVSKTRRDFDSARDRER